MNSLDLTVLIIMVVSLTVSTFRGGIREAFSLAAVVAGFVLAAHFHAQASRSFLRLTSHEEINGIISFLVIFISSAVLISFIGGRLTGMVKKSKLKTWNMLAGTAIGTVKGIVVSALVVYMLMVFLPPKSGVFTKSAVFPFAYRLTEAFSPIAPRFFRDEFEKKVEELKKGAVPPEKAEPTKKSQKK